MTAAGTGTVDLTGSRPPGRVVRLATEPEPIRVDLARSALLVIDMSNDCAHPEGWAGVYGGDIRPAAGLVAPIAATSAALRGAGARVIWVNWAVRSDAANLPAGLRRAYRRAGGGGLGAPVAGRGHPAMGRGGWGARVLDALPVGAADIVVGKHRVSGFFDTELDGVLRAQDIGVLFFAGVNTDQCVLATLVDAACLGYECVLLTDCTATTSPGYCRRAALHNVRECYGHLGLGRDLRAAIGGEP
ncbi:cysteine hydrolase family protein [Dactylosporangium sp. CA-092794]|uniref:cysteine hydrolase family protein n=1 Tax=Dactylosporangium sp. CA-092794 TaxID=3239929 RepID=UPI003D8F9DDF